MSTGSTCYSDNSHPQEGLFVHLDQGAVPHTLGYHKNLLHKEDDGRSVDFDNIQQLMKVY